MEHTLHAHKEHNPAKHKKAQQKQNNIALFWTHTIHTTPITHTLIYPHSITISVAIFGHHDQTTNNIRYVPPKNYYKVSHIR